MRLSHLSLLLFAYMFNSCLGCKIGSRTPFWGGRDDASTSPSSPAEGSDEEDKANPSTSVPTSPALGATSRSTPTLTSPTLSPKAQATPEEGRTEEEKVAATDEAKSSVTKGEFSHPSTPRAQSAPSPTGGAQQETKEQKTTPVNTPSAPKAATPGTKPLPPSKGKKTPQSQPRSGKGSRRRGKG